MRGSRKSHINTYDALVFLSRSVFSIANANHGMSWRAPVSHQCFPRNCLLQSFFVTFIIAHRGFSRGGRCCVLAGWRKWRDIQGGSLSTRRLSLRSQYLGSTAPISRVAQFIRNAARFLVLHLVPAPEYTRTKHTNTFETTSQL
jgi:hypothetical protein